MTYSKPHLLLVLIFAGLLNSGAKNIQNKPISPSFSNCKNCILLAEQSTNRIAILNLNKSTIIWEWLPQSATIRPEHISWFKYPSDAKVVAQGKCILMTASGGAVALIRIADKKVLFYAEAGGNPHSAELLPDGNIVTASSHGNYLRIFRTDTLQFPLNVYSKTVPLPYGHNVAWDKKNNLLWTASRNKLKTFTYNFDSQNPDLVLKDSISLMGNGAHDLFPVYNQNALWISTTKSIFKYTIRQSKADRVSTAYRDVKSISSGPKNYPDIIITAEKNKKGWWTDEILSIDGKVIFKQPGLKIYKARWFIENEFSY